MHSLPETSESRGPQPSSVIPPAEDRWYAVQTRPRHEKKVALQIEEKGISAFLPLLTRVHQWSDRRKVVQVPLFPCYAFVHLIPSDENRLCVLKTDGVLGFVGIRGDGLPIPEKEIESIRTLVARGASFAPYPFLKVGQRVRIRGGCLDGLEGILVARDSNRNLIVSIDLIQRSVAVRIDGYDLEAT